MWWTYPLVFVSALVVDAAPISPPTWTVMVLLLINLDVKSLTPLPARLPWRY